MLLDVPSKNTLEIPSTNIAVGSTFDMASINWTVVHEDESGIYLITTKIHSNTVFHLGDYPNMYHRSHLASVCFFFSVAIGVYGNPKFLCWKQDNVLAYCHAVSYSNAQGGYKYFTNDTSRKATDVQNQQSFWLLSSVQSSGSVTYPYYVSTDGTITTTSHSSVAGFRPVIALKK